MYLAPIRSKAQVSEAKTVAVVAVSTSQLTHRERTEAVRIARDDDAVLRQEHQRERAFNLQQRFAQAPGERRSRERATRCRMTSVSLVDWKIDPSSSSSRRSSMALVRLPLCATAIWPLLQATERAGR